MDLYFENTGEEYAPVIGYPGIGHHFLRLPDEAYARLRGREFVLHHHTGSICAQNDYEPATP